MKKPSLALLLLAFAAPAVLAKLPAPSPEAKAKADETAAKAAWQAKVDAFQLCKTQDRIAARFGGKGQAQAAAPAAASASGAASGVTPVSTAAAPAAPPPCADPGPFAYNPPHQTPLETSGAHSPAGTAASPPSVRPESAQMAPATKN